MHSKMLGSDLSGGHSQSSTHGVHSKMLAALITGCFDAGALKSSSQSIMTCTHSMQSVAPLSTSSMHSIEKSSHTSIAFMTASTHGMHSKMLGSPAALTTGCFDAGALKSSNQSIMTCTHSMQSVAPPSTSSMHSIEKSSHTSIAFMTASTHGMHSKMLGSPAALTTGCF